MNVEIDHDKALYKNRLLEIDQDEKLGRLDADEAEVARVQEARKLLVLGQTSAGRFSPSGAKFSHVLLIASALFVFIFTVGFYISTATYSPSFRSFVSKQEPADLSVSGLLRAAESRLAMNSNDVRGWKVLAPIYLSLGQPEKGVAAFRQAVALSDQDPDLRAALGEALVVLANGQVSDEALQQFQQVISIDADNDLARYYIGLASAQNGQGDLAIEAWQEILDSKPENEQWVSFLTKRIASVEKEKTLSLMPELNNETVEAANELDKSERLEMINGMVASLAERLSENPDDMQGWERLIRSYIVLGRKSDALAAIQNAKSQFASRDEFIAKLEKIESELQ